MHSVSCVLWKAVWWVVLGVVVTDMICMVCEVQKYRTLLFQRTKDQKFKASKWNCKSKQQTDFCGDEVYGEFFGGPNSSSHGEKKAEQPPVSAAVSSSALLIKPLLTWCY